MKKVWFIAVLLMILPCICFGQFSSGSTGADGALDLSTINCPDNICYVQLPESGILNYTTVNITQNKELRFKMNSRNTAIAMLVQGNVIINGSIQLSAPGLISNGIAQNIPGPGGFYGGQPGKDGFGPGGGSVSSRDGSWVGSLSLLPITGGSGGFGSNTLGGGGGGAIVIASSTSITISANGSITSWGTNGDTNTLNGSNGAGGAIRLVANSLNIAGRFQACGFFGGNCGVVRFEAPQGQIIFTGNSNPSAVISIINSNIISSTQPKLTISSVGGTAVPSYSGSRFDTVDLLLPNQIPDPVNVVVSANNIPVGSQVSVGFVSGSGSGTSTTCNLSGTEASSQCTAMISNLNRTGVTYLLATATFTPSGAFAQSNPKGANQVAKIKLESVLGAKPKYVFLRADSTIIDAAKLSKEFLQNFGM